MAAASVVVAAAQLRAVGGSLEAALSSSGERGRRGTRRRREEGTIVCRRAVPLRHRPAGGRRRGDMRPGRERARSGPSSRPGEGDTRRELPTGGGGEGRGRGIAVRDADGEGPPPPGIASSARRGDVVGTGYRQAEIAGRPRRRRRCRGTELLQSEMTG